MLVKICIIYLFKNFFITSRPFFPSKSNIYDRTVIQSLWSSSPVASYKRTKFTIPLKKGYFYCIMPRAKAIGRISHPSAGYAGATPFDDHFWRCENCRVLCINTNTLCKLMGPVIACCFILRVLVVIIISIHMPAP